MISLCFLKHVFVYMHLYFRRTPWHMAQKTLKQQGLNDTAVQTQRAVTTQTPSRDSSRKRNISSIFTHAKWFFMNFFGDCFEERWKKAAIDINSRNKKHYGSQWLFGFPALICISFFVFNTATSLE